MMLSMKLSILVKKQENSKWIVAFLMKSLKYLISIPLHKLW